MGTRDRSFFEINQRFEVDRNGNTIYDRKRDTRHRLEPRLMRLLCLLADNEGEVVSRETIIKEIWDDYPGAGDGLNQGISHLRKVLEDDKRSLIRTLPKIGYLFEGLTPPSSNSEADAKKEQHQKKRRLRYLVPILLLLSIVFFASTFFTKSKSDHKEENNREVSAIDESRQYFREDQKQAEDSLVFVHAQVLKFANLHINDINNKAKEDSMKHWNLIEDNLLKKVAAAKFSLDSLRKVSKP